MNIEWKIPPSVLLHLDRAPQDRPVILLLRHSVRNELPLDSVGYDLPITNDGVRIAHELGEVIGTRLKTLHTSPLLRCVQTAEAVREGAKANLTISNDRLMGDPGAFVLDGQTAWRHWKDMGHEQVMTHLMKHEDALEGMARPKEAAHFMVHHMLAVANDEPGIHVFVTHDSLVAAAAARLMKRVLGSEDWPWFLEGAFFWREENRTISAYRDMSGSTDMPLCDLSAQHVIEFARREVAMTFGLDCPARFFLAGGAFKTLLSGRATADLDFWPASSDDRLQMISRLKERGASLKASKTYCDAFELSGRTIEVPHKCEPSSLEGRLERFDLALSAIGVEYDHGKWRAVIHPLALESVAKRQILLLKPLVNWKHSLATLERMRRYAQELGYESPIEEEAEIWRIFKAQSKEMRQSMKERFERTTRGGFGIEEEVACRFP